MTVSWGLNGRQHEVGVSKAVWHQLHVFRRARQSRLWPHLLVSRGLPTSDSILRQLFRTLKIKTKKIYSQRNKIIFTCYAKKNEMGGTCGTYG